MDGGHVHDARFSRGGGLCPVIPLGATVRWRDTIYKSAWSGVVTGHPRAKMVEVDGRGAISEGLLEVVDMTVEEDRAFHEMNQLQQECAQLTEVVTQQCELIASMTADASEIKRLQAVEDDFQRLRDAVSDALLALTRTRRPSQRDYPGHALSEFRALMAEMDKYEMPSGD